MEALFITVGVIGSVVLITFLVVWFLRCVFEDERFPWQHKKECPCSKCFAARMKAAVEKAEYANQEREIKRAVDEMTRAARP